MGVAATIIATLGAAFLQGEAARRQANAQAAQAEKNAEIAMRNSEKQQENAEEQAQNNAINAENKRRRMRQYEGQQRANIGAAGITQSGSALMTLADTRYAQEMELGMDAYNGRQKVDEMVSSSNDMYNQSLIYQQNARDYRKAGKRAFMTSMLMGGLSLAGNLYGNSSAGAQKSAEASGGSVGAGAKYDFSTPGKLGYVDNTWRTDAVSRALGNDTSLGGKYSNYSFDIKPKYWGR